jgi:hypothetical protein
MGTSLSWPHSAVAFMVNQVPFASHCKGFGHGGFHYISLPQTNERKSQVSRLTVSRSGQRPQDLSRQSVRLEKRVAHESDHRGLALFVLRNSPHPSLRPRGLAWREAIQ